MPQQPTNPNDWRMQSRTEPSHNYDAHDQQANVMRTGSVGSNGTDAPAPRYGGGRTGADDYYAAIQADSQPSYQPAPSSIPSRPAPSYSFGGAPSSATAAQGSPAPSYAQYPPTPTARTAPMPWETERSDAVSFALNAVHPVDTYVPNQDSNSSSNSMAAYAQMRPSAARGTSGAAQYPSSSTQPYSGHSANQTQRQGSRRSQGGGQGG
ncbi:hypothetical protein [Streptomyces sp. NPDC006645]|uniref:hypothetical protein n=1 Tax=unclassified Streptomyces TaxID=2593676 RepID=UPI00339E3A54